MNRPDQLESVARAIVSALGIGVLEAAVLAALVLAVARLSRASATTRHVLWWIALAAGTALPFVSIAASLGRIEHRAPVAATSTAADWASSAGALGAQAAPARARQPVEPARPAATLAATRRAEPQSPPRAAAPANWLATATGMLESLAVFPRIAVTIVAAWLAVALVLVALLGRSLLALVAIKRAALPLDESIVRRLRRWRHSTRLGRPVALRVSHDVDVPVAVGFWTPAILLPLRVVETEDVADLDQIALHEYAHLERYDDWTNLAQRFLERVFWFNPVVLFLGRRISLEREIACDDWVVAQTGRAHRYATCLWKLVESARLPAKQIVAPGALFSAKQITKRIEQLLDSRRNALPRLSPFGALALGALAIAFIVIQAQRAPVIAVEDVPAALAVRADPLAAAAALPAKPAPAAAPHAVAVPSPAAAPDIPSTVARSVAAALANARATARARALPAHVRADVNAAVAHALRRDSASAIANSVAAVATTVATSVAANVVTSVADSSWGDREPATLDRETIARCLGCNLRGRDLRGIDLHGIALTGADLRDADLRGVDLSGAKLVGVDLRAAKLDGANLSDASLSGCDLRDASLSHANLDGIRLTGTSIHGTTLGGSSLRSIVDRCMGCDLRGLDLRGQDLHGIELTGADLRDADLRGANLAHARLVGVDMRGARVAGADLTNAELEGCNLDGVDLNGAKTQGMSTNGVGMDRRNDADTDAIAFSHVRSETNRGTRC